MAEDILPTIARLKESNELKNFLESHKKAFLASFSLMAEPSRIEKAKWQIDYFNPENGKMTSFVMGEPIIVKPEQEVLQTRLINEINPDETKIGFFSAFEISQKRFAETAHESASSFIAVLQNSLKLQWTITYITASMKVMTYQINAETGDISSEQGGNFGIKL